MKRFFALLLGVALCPSATAGTMLFNEGTVQGGAAGVGTVVTGGAAPTLTPSTRGTVDIAIDAGEGLERGLFTANGSDLELNSGNFTFTAGWLVPTGSSKFAGNDGSPGDERGARLFAGVHTAPQSVGFGSGAEQYGVVGIEYDIASDQWVLSSDNSSEIGLDTPLSPAPNFFQVRVTKQIGVLPDGGDADSNPDNQLTLEYAVDFGPFQLFPTNVIGNPVNTSLGGSLADDSTDAFGWSLRGRGGPNFSFRFDGDNVPNIGVAIDSDGDGTFDENDPFPFDAEYDTDSDGDGLPDQWELENFGDLTQSAGGDFEGDGVSNINEFFAGSDPTVQVPVTGSFGIAVLAAMLILLGGMAGIRHGRV